MARRLVGPFCSPAVLLDACDGCAPAFLRRHALHHRAARFAPAHGQLVKTRRLLPTDGAAAPPPAGTFARHPRGCCWRKSPTVLIIRRSEEHTSELQSLMRTSYAVLCLKKTKKSA